MENKRRYTVGTLTREAEFSYQDEWQTTNLVFAKLIGTWAYELISLRPHASLSTIHIYVEPMNEMPAFIPTKEQIASSFELRLFKKQLQDSMDKSIGRRLYPDKSVYWDPVVRRQIYSINEVIHAKKLADHRR